MSFIDKDLQSIQEARILIEQASVAQTMLLEYPQSLLDRVTGVAIQELTKIGPTFLEKAVQESKYGNLIDESTLLNRVLTSFSEDYLPETYVGILTYGTDGKVLEIGVPLGITVILLPAENTIVNAIFSILTCLKTGNACVVVPHKRALSATQDILSYLERLVEENGLPRGSVSCVSHLSDEGVLTLLDHPQTAAVINIGNLNYTDTPLKNSKPIFYGGTGSTPVFIEKTANIQQACQQIVTSRSFDNGILAGAEQYLITEALIAQQVKEELIRQGAYFMTQEDEVKLLELMKPYGTEGCSEVVGQSAVNLAFRAGMTVPATTKLLVSEQNYILTENPYTDELKFPILVFYLEPDWLRACEKCLELLKEKRNGHSLVIHSKNEDVIEEFALKKPVARVLVNAPATFASMGLGSNLNMTVILGGLTIGHGVTAKNITPKELTYIRQIGYEKAAPNVTTKSASTTIPQEPTIDGLIKMLKELAK
ncbi:hypothetical protein CBF34_08405 [Vagococcus penaei]|uniref:Aldehyde dehydrogenase domain-containing protein n=1 Tax=Vagococcus penaei TaxID=633807 RepID=A0A1Q2D5V5_9ENTE|nr:aldehyde dehydrogenase family protein [Vagococcus penaei]AQP53768.1 hypothetical protein BW732_05625 [Vagococcus penaei]RSU00401.1 hypothetical protein CBF34_08405 [Vagococcus penaei]